VVWKSIQGFLWIIALLCLGYCAEITVKAKWSQSQGGRDLEHSVVSTAPALGDVVGRIEIPRLNLSTVVFEGAGDEELERGAGHLPASALPGKRGNMVLAAHRDTFFRPLRNIRVGDRVHIHRPSGDSVYIVKSAWIVEPDQVDVLKPTAESALTLITCYPFRYIGPAPERFVVRAVLAP
jgi:sortase A